MSSHRALMSTLCALAIALLPWSATARPLKSSPRLGVSLVWSLHEPWIARDAGGNVFAKPDLRFHALHDVRPMAAMVSRFPGLHAAFDLSPVLLEQLDAYDHGAIDRALLVANRPADRLSETDKAQIEATLLEAPESAFQRFPAYQALRAKPRAQYSAQDWRDLQVWHLLAWLDPAERTQAPFVDLVLQRRDFTEAQKLMALYRARQLLTDTISLYRRLQDSGAIEIATSPYYHPFLPMIAGEAIASPSNTARFEFPQDASDQLSMACDSYRHLFGRPARGMVPVADAWTESLSPVLEQQGVRWLLAPANGRPTSESGVARISAIEGLDETTGEDARSAARTLLARLHGMAGHRPRWAVVHVDVDDLARRFPGSEDAFVTELYRGLLSGHWAETLTPSEGLARYGKGAESADGPSTRQRPTTWVEAEGARREWNVLLNARRTLELYRREHGENFRYAKAHRLMLAAESSDWFASAERDSRFPPEFEQLITDVYQAIGAPADAVLQQSVGTATGSVAVRPAPPATLMVAIPDATGDALGAGQLVAPLDPRMPVEDFDLRQLEVAESGDQWVFTIYLGALDNPWHTPNGLGLPTIDLYLSSQSSPATASALLTGRGAFGDRAWNEAIVLEGFQSGLYAPDGMRLQPLNPEVDAWHKRVIVRVPKAALKGTPATWRYLLISLAQDAFSSGRIRPLSPRPDLFHFSGHGAPILDVLTTDASQSELLDPSNKRVVLPFVAPPPVRTRPIVDRLD